MIQEGAQIDFAGTPLSLGSPQSLISFSLFILGYWAESFLSGPSKQCLLWKTRVVRVHYLNINSTSILGTAFQVKWVSMGEAWHENNYTMSTIHLVCSSSCVAATLFITGFMYRVTLIKRFSQGHQHDHFIHLKFLTCDKDSAVRLRTKVKWSGLELFYSSYGKTLGISESVSLEL